MKGKLIAFATAVLTLITTGAFAASRVAGNSGCCPPCPFCH